MHIYGFSTFFFFPEQYRLHAKQGDAASAGNFSHSHHSTLNELFFCVFWKRFVSNGGLHFTLHTFTRFYEFCGLNLLVCVFLNHFFWRWSWWLHWTWPEWHPFPSWGFCPWSQLYLGSIWVSPMQPQCSWAKKKEVHWRSVHKMGTWYCCGTRRLMINNQSVKSSAGHCVCV